MNKASLYLIIIVSMVFLSSTIDLSNLFNYEQQNVPNYINKDNTNTNLITDEGATLGRVLFYDKNLSSDNTVSCSSCHMQEFAFGDTATVSQGVNGVTGRHSMRLINSKFTEEDKFFWDERAKDLETQTTMPIKDHGEMGFSGSNGDPDFDDLIYKLNAIDYYKHLFFNVFQDTIITENRIQFAIAQFIRSIQSFDSKFDTGRTMAPNDIAPFQNYTQSENRGKMLFITPPQFDQNGSRVNGGAGCAGCHRPPEFDIDPDSKTNGILLAAGSLPGPNRVLDTIVKKSPTLRDLFNSSGVLNGPMMHTGNFRTLAGVIQHYNQIPSFGQISNFRNLVDPRLLPGGLPQKLNLSQADIVAITNFIKTLSGSDVYTNEKWSNPFDERGNLSISGSTLAVNEKENTISLNIFPNPTIKSVRIESTETISQLSVFDLSGKLVLQRNPKSKLIQLELIDLPRGVYIINVLSSSGVVLTEKIIKQ